MPIQATHTPAQTAVLELTPVQFEPDELTEALTECPVGEKDGEALIPAIFRTCPETCHNEGKKKRVNCGGSAWHRLNANVEAMTLLGVDLDDISSSEVAARVASLRAQGLQFWLWETHSHNPPDNCRVRILIPFHKPFPLVNPQQWSIAAWPALMGMLGFTGAAEADSAARDPSRVYYLPRRPSPEALRAVAFYPGKELNWEDWLPESVQSGFIQAVQGPHKPPEQDPDRPVDMADLKERWRKVHTGSKEMIQKVLRGEAPAPSPKNRKRGQHSRYTAWRTVTSSLAAVAHDWEGTEALLSLLHPAWMAEVEEDPVDPTQWETVEQLLDSARDAMPAYRAQREAERNAKRDVFRKILAVKYGGKLAEDHIKSNVPRLTPKEPETAPQPETQTETVEAEATEGEATEGEPEEEEGPVSSIDWLSLLDKREDAEGDEVLESTSRNVFLFLLHSEPWLGVLRFNDFAQRVYVFGGPFPDSTKKGRILTDADSIEVANWLAAEVGLRVKSQQAREQIEIVARRNRYDPLRDWLLGLEHDGKPRAHRLLAKYFNAPTLNSEGEDIREHLEALSIRWMVSAVARALDPGCKVDTVLHITAGQGQFKSTALATLAGREWFRDDAINFNDKDGLLPLSSTWIIELGEQTAFRKSDVAIQKQFLGKLSDTYRPPYGRELATFLRRCVFVATGNETEYLTDRTGNRRHWTVTVGRADIEALKLDRSQLWAEAVAMYHAGVQWHLTDAEEVIAAQEVELRLVADAVEEAIVHHYLSLSPQNRPTYLNIREIISTILKEDPTKSNQMRVAAALASLGFLKVRKQEGAVRTRHWAAPESLMMAPKVTSERKSAELMQAMIRVQVKA